MPYITTKQKEDLNRVPVATSAGELNYMLTCTILDYLKLNGLSYATINDIVGALEGAKLEFYRRIAEPYENKKILDNGDVYPAVTNLLPPKDSEGGG